MAGIGELDDIGRTGDKIQDIIKRTLKIDKSEAGSGVKISGAVKEEVIEDIKAVEEKASKALDDIAKEADNIIKSDRNLPGVVTSSGGGNVSHMMRGTQGNIGLIPKEVADKLSGRSFNNFDELRSEFWREIANSSYAGEFSISNITRMSNGFAPKVAKSQQYGELSSYVLHHKTPIHVGGGVYDLDNLVIVTPRMHQEILDKTYHFSN